MWTLNDIEDKLKKGKIRGFQGKGVQLDIIKKSKYGNKKTEVDGIVFDSKKEAKRYGELKILLKKGLIGLLEMQRVFELEVNGVIVARYKADFCYLNEQGELVVEDVKSAATRKIATYRLKKKLMKTIHQIEIKEI